MRRSRRRAALLLLLGLPRARTRGTGGCPVHKTSGHMVQCSGHGDCNADNACACWPDWTGAACSERACPSATAWADVATDTDTAHAPAECAGRGECDVKTGLCACMPGFTGRACERSTCSAPGEPSCSGHGRCVSMQRHAADAYAPSTARTQYAYDAPWDATMLFGCMCEAPYAGFDCSYRTCATGDIPTTTGQVNEVQLIQCTGASSGELTLWWEGSAVVLGAQLSAWQVKSALEAGFAGVRGLAVEFLPAGTTTLCSETLTVAQVEFTHDFGALSDMEVVYEDANGDETLFGSSPSAAVLAEGGDNAGSFFDEAGTQYKAIDGTKEESLCAGKGLCNREEGLCECLESNLEYFGSSDGYGRAGTRGECGYPLQAVAYCPGEISCSGHGVCHDGTDDTDGLLYLSCECSAGWTGADCSLRECPKGLSWFAYPSANDEAHDAYVECSNGGVCDQATGECACGPVFSGAACERALCPPGHGEPECAGHGVCMTMAQLAEAAEINGEAAPVSYGADPNNALTWDAHRMTACKCDESWQGSGCRDRTCPYGDDPVTLTVEGSTSDPPEAQANERQLLACKATEGTFTLSFRQQTTGPLGVNVTATELEAALEALTTITDVRVRMHGAGRRANGALCDEDGAAVAQVQFVTEHGDVPALVADVSALLDMNVHKHHGKFYVKTDGQTYTSGGVKYASFTGTTENVECSNHGVCDRLTGLCECFVGWTSSDGEGGYGMQNDCGARVSKYAGGIA